MLCLSLASFFTSVTFAIGSFANGSQTLTVFTSPVPATGFKNQSVTPFLQANPVTFDTNRIVTSPISTSVNFSATGANGPTSLGGQTMVLTTVNYGSSLSTSPPNVTSTESSNHTTNLPSSSSSNFSLLGSAIPNPPLQTRTHIPSTPTTPQTARHAAETSVLLSNSITATPASGPAPSSSVDSNSFISPTPSSTSSTSPSILSTFSIHSSSNGISTISSSTSSTPPSISSSTSSTPPSILSTFSIHSSSNGISTISSSTSSTYPSVRTSSVPPSSNGTSLIQNGAKNKIKIAGIVVGSVVGAVISIIATILLSRRWRRRQAKLLLIPSEVYAPIRKKEMGPLIEERGYETNPVSTIE